jgi:8-oxo-dGTP pyrophosphatase MutT (NUDIX family)
MRTNDGFLVIERSDGRGLSFPGGIAMPWEGTEQAMVREFAEETGLKVTASQLKFSYFSGEDVPVNLAVFEVEADGQLRGSWEGDPRWARTTELCQRLLRSQKRIVETLPEL